MRLCPDQKVIGIRRIEDLKKDGLA
jgi:hypothetical protein